ncbi:integrase, partial [Salmonella enterica subsp. enterica serovar Oslo]|nr:integrase [Salmonella enterica subsp. enterica serovar Oslo]
MAKFIDPLEEQRASQEKVLRDRVNTIKNVAANWYEMKKSAGLKSHTWQDIWNSLNRYVLPHIGEINIDELTAQQVIAAMEPCRADGK